MCPSAQTAKKSPQSDPIPVQPSITTPWTDPVEEFVEGLHVVGREIVAYKRLMRKLSYSRCRIVAILWQLPAHQVDFAGMWLTQGAGEEFTLVCLTFEMTFFDKACRWWNRSGGRWHIDHVYPYGHKRLARDMVLFISNSFNLQYANFNLSAVASLLFFGECY